MSDQVNLETQDEDLDQEVSEADQPEDLRSRLEELQEAYDSLKKEDRYRMAEFDNFRRRTRTEQEELRKTAARNLLVELLDVADGLADAVKGSETSDLEAWRDGVLMIARKFNSVLEAQGVSEIEAEGVEFDPSLHEALFVVDEGEHQGQIVSQVIQRGYLLQDKVLRLAKVKVARGQASESD